MDVPVGKKIALRSGDLYLNGKKEKEALQLTKGDPKKDPALQWVITKIPDSYAYTIKNVSSNCYLDGREKFGMKAIASNRAPNKDPSLQWFI